MICASICVDTTTAFTVTGAAASHQQSDVDGGLSVFFEEGGVSASLAVTALTEIVSVLTPEMPVSFWKSSVDESVLIMFDTQGVKLRTTRGIGRRWPGFKNERDRS